MTSILYLRALGHEFPAFLELPEAEGITAKYLRELSDEDFDQFDAILVPAHVDQLGLSRRSATLTRFLNRGGTLVFNGHLVYPVLPELEYFVTSEGTHKDDLVIERADEHPVFDGVSDQDLSFRRGVSGFYGRGANPPPSGARVLARMKKSRAPLDWYWERPGGGRILMHAGNTLWMYAGSDNSTARIAPQLLNWLKTSPSATLN